MCRQLAHSYSPIYTVFILCGRSRANVNVYFSCVEGRVVQNVVEHQKPDMFTESSGLDDFDETLGSPVSQVPEVMEEEEEPISQTGDFADEIRRRIGAEFNEQQEIAGFQVS